MEVVVWPAVHDPELSHTLRWLPELAKLPKDLAREPWRTAGRPVKRIKIKPYKAPGGHLAMKCHEQEAEPLFLDCALETRWKRLSKR